MMEYNIQRLNLQIEHFTLSVGGRKRVARPKHTATIVLERDDFRALLANLSSEFSASLRVKCNQLQTM